MKNRKNNQALHKSFALIALLTIFVFWMATIISEVFLDKNVVIIVKQSIAYYGLAIMILSMAGAGITGFLMSKNSTYPLILNKKKRMPFIAGNGLLLIICALILSIKASNCSIPDDHIDPRRSPLFMAKCVLKAMSKRRFI